MTSSGAEMRERWAAAMAAIVPGAVLERRRYRRLRDMASETLVDPRNSHADLIDTRTEWRLPTLICSGPIGGFNTFDEAVDIATGDSNG